ncbi:Wzz/FepE/Etk N-terminal domain-containing protein [Pseudomonas fontis]|uniref:Wzz/FepE/Etk N-terminal domain-containing protein n=1 Tax=Pseudomonas fontis TaxID=2942633 RepID=A0ABT5NVK0_9PSED|nr:Wzz/FepE/Etk N-terminal domain-containing protein [Pseudomonas fontis]MDD0975544.1 Wzz/FepE/Etk N-terminal domain-containing protein [Pseudomonas fontis]MDD0992164.1 Wzz/FepE/Etk N-terminal domain-containing protein [Pseudomonas fontis]
MGKTLSGFFEAPTHSPGTEIDFYALSQAIWRQKRLVMVVALVGCVLSLGYAFLTTPVYQVSSVLRPAAVNELDALNRSEIYSLPPNAALSRVAVSLGSYETQLNFFRDNEELFSRYIKPGRSLEQNFRAFNKDSAAFDLQDVNQVDEFRRLIELKFDYVEGVDGAAVLNKFVAYAIDVERQKITADLNVLIKNRLSEINGKIDFARATYQLDKGAKIAVLRESDNLKRARLQDELKALRLQLKILRGDRASQLNEAIAIARSLGIKKPSTPSSLTDSDLSSGANIIRTEVSSQQAPLYFLGTDALEAELSTLQKRTSDDFEGGRIAEIAKELQLLQANREIEVLNSRSNEDIFLRDVQASRAEAARLGSLGTDLSRVQLVSVDQRAMPSDSPIRPKRLLVVLFGTALGLILGLLLAFVRYQFSVLRARSYLHPATQVLDVQAPAGVSQRESARLG